MIIAQNRSLDRKIVSAKVNHTFYAATNEVPPVSRVRRLRKEPNVVQVNPDGTQHLVRMTLAQDAKEQMCTDAQQVIKVGQ